MTRLQKKCFLFSVGLHGLLLAVLVASSAFRGQPEPRNIHILTMIPANIIEGDSANLGGPGPVAREPAPAPPQVQQQPVVQTPPTPVPPRPVEPVKPIVRPKPREVARELPLKPEIAKEPAPRPRATHEIHPTFDQVSPANQQKNNKENEMKLAEATARAKAKRLKQIEKALQTLSTSVKKSGSEGTVVDMEGEGGGPSFAGYETVIYNAYYHAWITPDSVANRQAATDVKIVVARDGAILSAEIINKSGEPLLDRSVERALRAVPRLQPFPPSAHDEERSFLIRFNLDAKEGSG